MCILKHMLELVLRYVYNADSLFFYKGEKSDIRIELDFGRYCC